MEDCRFFVENLVDELGDGAYSPSSALLMRTVTWVTDLAKGLGKPGRGLDQFGKTEGRRVRHKKSPGAARP